MSERPKGQPITRRRGRGFPGLLGNALTPLSKAQENGASSSSSSASRWSRKFSISSKSSSKPEVGPDLQSEGEQKKIKPKSGTSPASQKNGTDSHRGDLNQNSPSSSAGQHGTVELCIVDGLNLPLAPGQRAYWLVDYDSEFSTTPTATYAEEDGKPVWNATSTHDVALVGGKVMLYLYLAHGDKRAEHQQQQHQQTLLLGTAQIRLGDRLQDGKSETHWVSFSSNSSDELATGCVRVTTTYRKPKTSRIGPRDFVINRTLGKGSFGTVYQVKKKESGRSYAMKVLSKEAIAKRNMSPHVLSERKILQLTHLAAASPFLVCLKFSFQTKNHLYLVMDLKRGGELFSHMQKEGGKFSEDRVRFYAAEIIVALQTLHENKVVYRDLKPENILLDEAGHVCLCDFGLAKLLEHKTKTKTFCGTAEYLPPEMIESDAGYDYLVDWWSLGCMIFELLCGFTPFYSEDNMDKFAKIVKADLRIPKRGFSPAVTDLIERLLCRDPEHRLGARGAKEIKEHPFFSSIDWAALAEKRVQPPFKPETDDDPTHEMEFDEEGPPTALLPFVNKSNSSEDRRQQHSKRSSCQPSPTGEEPEEHDDHWWRDFTFAQQTVSSRASLASVAPAATLRADENQDEAEQDDGILGHQDEKQSTAHNPSSTNDGQKGLYHTFDEPLQESKKTETSSR